MKRALSLAMLKSILSISFVFLTLLLMISCGEAERNEGEYYTFTDSAGVQISLDAKPQRVAVLFSSFAEIWSLAGGEVAVTVGETVERGLADSSTPLVDSGAGKSISTELLISYKPDLVIASADIPAQVNAANLLNGSGIPCALFSVENLEDYLQTLRIFTQITGNSDAYATYGDDVSAQITELLSAVPKNTKRRILFIRASSSAKSTKAKTASEHFAALMLKELGTYNIAEAAPALLDGLSLEEILIQKPDCIFISTMGDEESARAYIEELFSSSGWKELDAVKNGQYYFLEKELFQYKPNHRWYLAYLKLWEFLYE